MAQFSLVFTILFMLLGPLKIIVPFAGLTAGADEAFKRAVAIRVILIASLMVAVLAVAGDTFLGRLRISIDAVRLAGGLILLLAALFVMFSKAQPRTARRTGATPMQLAATPLATPVIVPPAGIAAILIFTLLTPAYPAIVKSVAVSLALIMVLDFLAMYYNSAIMKIHGLTLVLQVLSAVLVFLQAALAVQVMLNALTSLGIVRGPGP